MTTRTRLDLAQYLLRQMAFSHATFGPGERRKGVIDHMKKELKEVEDGDGAAAEWVDLVLLALDGLTRRLAYANGGRGNPEEAADTAVRMIVGKLGRNEARVWPDWRSADPDKAIEHDRSYD